ncbi:MAG: hypothetical protein KJ799_09145 [Bacteroidetes bacterium]|nr:hypothetical protein [Bacteroidota bacterium]MBU2506875.1 hypothetical protein [Bacteroidota bacterium]
MTLSPVVYSSLLIFGLALVFGTTVAYISWRIKYYIHPNMHDKLNYNNIYFKKILKSEKSSPLPIPISRNRIRDPYGVGRISIVAPRVSRQERTFSKLRESELYHYYHDSM